MTYTVQNIIDALMEVTDKSKPFGVSVMDVTNEDDFARYSSTGSFFEVVHNNRSGTPCILCVDVVPNPPGSNNVKKIPCSE